MRLSILSVLLFTFSTISASPVPVGGMFQGRLPSPLPEEIKAWGLPDSLTETYCSDRETIDYYMNQFRQHQHKAGTMRDPKGQTVHVQVANIGAFWVSLLEEANVVRDGHNVPALKDVLLGIQDHSRLVNWWSSGHGGLVYRATLS